MYDESAIEVFTTPSGLERHRLPVIYPQLNKHRNIASDTPAFAVHKAVFQEMLWKEQFHHLSATKQKKLGLEMNAKRPEVASKQKQKIAEMRTELAQQELTHAYKLLGNALQQAPKFAWDVLKEYPDCPKPKPEMSEAPEAPVKPPLPREPLITDAAFRPKLGPLEKLVRSKREEKEREAHLHFETAHTQWEQLTLRVRRLYQEQMAQYKQQMQVAQESARQAIQDWEQAKEDYYREREKCVQIVEEKKSAFEKHDPHAVLDYFDMVLAISNYPASFPQSYEMDFEAKEKMLILDYLLPPLKGLPRLSKVAYNQELDAFVETVIDEEKRDNLYAQLLHEIPLRTFHEVFSMDTVEAVAAIQFRGYLYVEEDEGEDGESADPVCILAVRAEREPFCEIDFSQRNALDVFEEMGGVIHADE